MKSKRQPEGVTSLNDTGLTRLSIEELEARLAIEDIDVTAEMWTGCNCATACAPDITPPSPTCPTNIFCGYRGQW